jgi:hypothetical protein
MLKKGPTIIPRNNPQVAVAMQRAAERRKTMQPHQQRVVDEKKELDEKLDRLKAFIDTNPTFKTLHEDERGRLNRQFDVMAEYSSILSQRITAF